MTQYWEPGTWYDHGAIVEYEGECAGTLVQLRHLLKYDCL